MAVSTWDVCGSSAAHMLSTPASAGKGQPADGKGQLAGHSTLSFSLTTIPGPASVNMVKYTVKVEASDQKH